MKKYIYILLAFLISCKPDITPETEAVDEVSILKISNVKNVLEIDDEESLTVDLIKGNDTTFNIVGSWSSSDVTIGSIDGDILKINEEGIFKIFVSSEDLMDSLTINAVAKGSIAREISINTDNQEIGIGDVSNFSVSVLDGNSNELTLENTTWQVSDTNIATISATGVLTPKRFGAISVSVESNGLISKDVAITIYRAGTFVGKERHTASGGVRLLSVNGQIVIETQSDFKVQTGAPDLRVFLSNIENGSRVNAEGLELSVVTATSGKSTYRVPVDVDINDYQYVNMHCKQFNTTFGSAKFN